MAKCYIRRDGASQIWRNVLAARILMALSASIILTLGAIHLAYTFWGPKLIPRDPALQISMKQVSPVITKETTIWQCWVGFNATHSMGLILFGLLFGFLGLAHGQLLFQSPFLLLVGLAMLGALVVLCKVYLFSVPLIGVSIALACYIASIAVSRFQPLMSRRVKVMFVTIPGSPENRRRNRDQVPSHHEMQL